MLRLAIQARLPLILVKTDDLINTEEVLSFIAGCAVKPLQVPVKISKLSELIIPYGEVFFTSSECESLPKLYSFCVKHEKTIIFVNTQKSVLHFDGGILIPPKDLIRNFLIDVVSEEDVEILLPCFGGLTLKDVGEIAKLTMTRDSSLTPRGVNKTRRGFLSKLQGIQQVDTVIPFYVCPSYLNTWLEENKHFFLKPVHQSLVPRGLLFDGPAGTGKTLAAKRIADEFGVPLYRLDLGAMMGKYVGESESNLVAALMQIDQVEPCVVIFDEVEKIFQTSSDHGVTSRLLSQLLWWLQEHRTRVFSVMTTNKITDIPEELHREGRIDQTMTFLGLESFSEGYAFGCGALEIMAKDVDIKLNREVYVKLTKRLKESFLDTEALPQAKVIKMITDIIRTDYLIQHKEINNE